MRVLNDVHGVELQVIGLFDNRFGNGIIEHFEAWYKARGAHLHEVTDTVFGAQNHLPPIGFNVEIMLVDQIFAGAFGFQFNSHADFCAFG